MSELYASRNMTLLGVEHVKLVPEAYFEMIA